MPLAKALKNQHYIAAACLATGMSIQDTAFVTGLDSNRVNQLNRSPLFQAEISKIRERLTASMTSDAAQLIQAEAFNSMKRIIEIRDNPHNNPTVRLRAAETILDRTMSTSKIHKQAPQSMAPQFTDDQAEMILKALDDDPIAHAAFHNASRPAIDIDLTETQHQITDEVASWQMMEEN